MKRNVQKALMITALGLAFMVFGANHGCDVYIDDNAWVDGGGTSGTSDPYEEDDDETENKLLISGSGEFIDVEYNHLVFPARLNWDSGLYFFAPDPEGLISGDRIICAASVGDDQIEGDCFRSGHVCHFDYWHDDWATIDEKEVYWLDDTSCKKGGEVGPFLVPLESPLCGQDPFPTCPPDDIFPSGPEEEGGSTATTTPGTTEADDVANQPTEEESHE